MQMTRLAAAALAVACLGWSQAQAQDQDRARAFVNSVSFTSSSDSLARWDNRICVGAVGLAPAQAQALVDRVSARAQQVGLRPGEPGCTANVMVIYAPDSDRLSREIVDQRRDLLGYASSDGQQTAGREAMEDFANQPRPIRWWHVSSTGRGSLRPVDGTTYQGSGMTAAHAAAQGDGGSASVTGSPTSDLEGTEAVRSNGSRTRVQVRPNDLAYVLVVVDARRVAGVPANAWMDYVAFVALAQIDARARTEEYSTVLNIFNSGATATGMTAWDEAYLAGLYDARAEVANRQAASISRRLASVQ
jgi:hypothetical protein